MMIFMMHIMNLGSFHRIPSGSSYCSSSSLISVSMVDNALEYGFLCLISPSYWCLNFLSFENSTWYNEGDMVIFIICASPS